MKTTQDPDPRTVEFSTQLKNNFSDHEIASFVLTLLGMSDLAHMFIWEKVKEFMEIPIEVKYSTIQHTAFFRLLSLVARNEYKKEEHGLRFMPIGNGAWKSDDDFEKRLIFVVKHYYESLKKEGKL